MTSPLHPSRLRVDLIHLTDDPMAVWTSVILPGISVMPGLAEAVGPLITAAMADYADRGETTVSAPAALLGFPSGSLTLWVHHYRLSHPDPEDPSSQLDLGLHSTILVTSNDLDTALLAPIFTGPLIAQNNFVLVDTETQGAVPWSKTSDDKIALAQPLTPRIVYPVTPAPSPAPSE